MKTKKFSKRLALKKETISTLNGKSLDEVKGGCNETDCRSCATKFVLCSIELCPISTDLPIC